MKVIRFLPGALPEPIEIENTLEALQKQVGGHIQAVTVGPDLCAICNEEGRLLNLPYMGTINYIPFFGPVLLVGVNGEDFCDVPGMEVTSAVYRIWNKEEENEGQKQAPDLHLGHGSDGLQPAPPCGSGRVP